LLQAYISQLKLDGATFFGFHIHTLIMVSCLGFVLVADMVFVQQSAGRYVLLAMFYELWLLMNYILLQDFTCDIRDLLEAWLGGSCESGA
jgi:hypothetical protein